MGHCRYCGDYETEKEIHLESITYLSTIAKEKNDKTDDEIRHIKNMNDENKTGSCCCGNINSDSNYCHFEGTISEVVEHERICLGYKREIITTKYLSSATAKCDTCGKVFYHTSKTMLPKVALTRHKKTCERTLLKKMKSQIRDQLRDCNKYSILKDILSKLE